MTREQQLEYRIAMIQDDLNVLRAFIYKQGLIDSFRKGTDKCDEAITHLNNIEIACDLQSDESLEWKTFS
jgi:hypothetical protein